jgi:hypothetical protein
LSWNCLTIKQYKSLQYFQFWRFELRLFLFLRHLNVNEYSVGRLLFKLNNWFERVKEKNFECVNKTKSFVRQHQKNFECVYKNKQIWMRPKKRQNIKWISRLKTRAKKKTKNCVSTWNYINYWFSNNKQCNIFFKVKVLRKIIFYSNN